MQKSYGRYIITSLSSIVICVVIGSTSFFPWLSQSLLDIQFRLRGTLPTSQAIVIIGVDEASLEEIGPWPFSRQTHATLLEKLNLARSVGFDFLFTGKNAGDQDFLQAIKAGPPVVFAVAKNYDGQLLKPPDEYLAHVRLGHIETSLGKKGLVRTVDLRKWGVPSLAYEVVRGRGTIDLDAVTSKKTINFYGPEFTFLYVSYADVLFGRVEADFFSDRYVFVGSQALAQGDVHVSPLSDNHPLPGVEVQATIANNLLDGSFVRELPAVPYVGCLLVIMMSFFLWPSFHEYSNITLSLLLVALSFGLTIVFFRFHIYLDLSIPLVFLALSYLSHLISQWLWTTATLLKEIRKLDKRLEEGSQQVFSALPAELDRVEVKRRETGLSTSSGIHTHLTHIHNGIEALALQNRFINHLLANETPPLVLWQKECGSIVIANTGFHELWARLQDEKTPMPDLNDFYKMIMANQTCDENIPRQTGNHDSFDVDRIVDLTFMAHLAKKHYRVVIHNIASSAMGFAGVMASFTDVTEIRELERVKGEVMNIVSHELKLPLTAILGFGEMLSDLLSGESKEFAEEICRQSNRLAKMIEDFLDIARIESGRYTLKRYPFDPVTLAQEAASAIEYSARNKMITLDVSLPEKSSPVLGDESLITQAMINLLDNAVKFSPENSTVHIKVIESEHDILFHVMDEGTGIGVSEKERVFDKFIRGKNEQRGTGFGLGLNFVRQVMDAHGGHAGVRDSAWGGADFFLKLPKSNQV